MKILTMTWTAAAILMTANISGALADATDQQSTRAEKFEARLKARFAKAGVNADGQLTRDEAKTGMPRVYAHFDQIDTDKKGFVTFEQIEAFVAKAQARKHQAAGDQET